MCMLFIMVYFAPLCSSILFSICFDFPMLHSHRPSSSFSAVSFPLFFPSLLYSYSRFLTLWLLTQFKMIKSIDIYLLRVFHLVFPFSSLSCLSPTVSLLQYMYKYIQLTAVPHSMEGINFSRFPRETIQT